MKNTKGFTLIELLVVIAIIGILAAIAMVNLNTARNKAKIASARGSMASMVASATLCLDGNGELNSRPTASAAACDGTDSTPQAGDALCTDSGAAGSQVWLDLDTAGFDYGSGCASSAAAGTFTYTANNAANPAAPNPASDCVITCSAGSGCTTSAGC